MNACLTLVLPRSLEEQIIDHLLQDPERVGPFSAHPVDGHGLPGAMESVAEKVRGRSTRVRIDILMDEADARDLVANLKQEFQGTQVLWWISPVIAAGSLS